MDVTGFLCVVVEFGMATLVLAASGEESGGTSEPISDLRLYPLNMSTTMFYYELNWQPPDNDAALRYTVRYMFKVRDEDMWLKLPQCDNITDTRCNIGEEGLNHGSWSYSIDTLYQVEGYELRFAKLVYKTESIFFNSRKNVTLLTPAFELKLQSLENGNARLFVLLEDQKHWLNGRSIGEHLEGQLQYQVQYWSQNEKYRNIKTITENYADREVEKEVSANESYCAKIRLYVNDSSDSDGVTIVSDWSEPAKCIGPYLNATTDPHPVEQNQPSHVVIIGACAGVIFLIIVILLVCCGDKVRRMCRRMKEKGPLPDVLMTIFQDGANVQNDRENYIYNCMTEENVDLFPHFPSTFHREGNRDSILPVKKHYTSDTILSSEMDATFGPDYLHIPVFDDETPEIGTSKFNMTYGVGYTYDFDRDYFVNGSQLFNRSSAHDRMSTTLFRPLLASTISDAESGVSSPSSSLWRSNGRPTTLSMSSSGSEMGLIFDIQRSREVSARTNLYLGQSPVGFNGEISAEIMNCSYSSNPTREIPDALFNDYKNISGEQ